MTDRPKSPVNLFDGKIQASLFDMDGVITDTASLHASAWKVTFDEFLDRRAKSAGTPFVPFEEQHDYRAYVDGKILEDGVRDFLASRGIQLPEGEITDAPDNATVHGIGNRKNALVMKLLDEHGVHVFEGSLKLIHALRDAGVKTAVVSSSRHTRIILESVHLLDLFDVRVDGEVAAEVGLRSKPAPDMFLEAARRLNVEPANAVVFEDALAGVAAARAGGFGLVAGVDRHNQSAALIQNGADITVEDLAELLA